MHDDVSIWHSAKGLPSLGFLSTRFHADSTLASAKFTNQNVLDKAPSSVAILVDRGLIMSRPFLENWTSYQVVILFLDGADDQEALVIGVRMAGHPNINLTLIHLREEVAVNCAGTIAVIKSMENNYELVMVGRNHDNLSPFLSGRHFGMGAIGDVLASADFMSNTTILVAQQQNNVEIYRNPERNFNKHTQVESHRNLEGNFNKHGLVEEEVEDATINSLV